MSYRWEILPSNPSQIIQQAKTTHSKHGKSFGKHFMSKRRFTPKIVKELNRIEEKEQKADSGKMLYKGLKTTHDFKMNFDLLLVMLFEMLMQIQNKF